ncbi:glycoside hydrolase family 13 protein [Gyrodon lividus]|nr:glycoside hydrolase family 13 protein [Gyrodon lividus]
MFQWDWDSIAAECTNLSALLIWANGYGYVQVSPAQEHVTGDEWWTDYQPVSYILTSKRGNRTQYANMIQSCEAAGVGIIADTIFNHMTGESNGTGIAGSPFTQYDYPAVPYASDNLHYCGLEPDNNIANWDNEVEVWSCQLGGFADLETDTEYIQQVEAAYANDLMSLGVKGLRLDAAKGEDLTAYHHGWKSYITQEVIWGAGQPVTPALYTGIEDVMEFRYTSALQIAFLGGGISSLENLDNQGWVAGIGANLFVADHDTERGGSSLNYQSPSKTYTLAHIFSLAHAYGTPTVLSSYEFSTYDQGAPNEGAGTCSDGTGENGPLLCQHRWSAIAGMAGFRNNVGSTALESWVSPAADQIAFGRGSLGFVAINNDDHPWAATFITSLPAGTYCDVISGASCGSGCAGASYTVAFDGTFTATVLARNAIAMHTGAMGTGTTVAITFAISVTTTYGENISLAGSLPELGGWDVDTSITLSSANYPTWVVTIELPLNTTFEYKFIRKEAKWHGHLGVGLQQR